MSIQVLMNSTTTPSRTTRLRLTRRGRHALAAIVALPLAAALGFAVLSGGAAAASRDEGAPAGSFETVTVQPGESLWAVAEQIAPQADPRDVVDELVRLNALSSVTVSAGQQLAVPLAYAAS